jgi:hypothetical protein
VFDGRQLANFVRHELASLAVAGSTSSGRPRFNKCYLADRLGLAIPIGLDMQTFRDRPLCRGYDSLLIGICCGIRKRSVIDVRQTTPCRKTAKLIEPRRRRRLELDATSRTFSMNDVSAASLR